MIDVDIMGLFVNCFPAMICNVDEMMVRLYNSLYTYMFVMRFIFFKFQPYPTVKVVTLESVPVHVSKSLVPKKGTLAPSFNSLTPKSVPVGTKNSRSEGFLLTKHNHTNIPTMMEPFPPPAPWF